MATDEVATAEAEPCEATARMVIVAHPDDAEFTCAGTVARWVMEGHRVIYVICTDGSRGSNDPGRPPEVMAPLRRAEQLEAAGILGVEQVLFLAHEDGTLEPTLELRRELTRLVRRYRPDIVICGDPTRIISRNVYINHPDHRAAAEGAVYAIFPSAVTRYIFPELLDEGLEPHKVREVYLYAPSEANDWVDISNTIDLKAAALKAHRSQVSEEYVDERLREWNGELGRKHGVAYAEEFRKIVLR
jgi:LmbE family N-acetylglucosaminyl deacetylase